jgi:hypothetical protein
MDDQNHTRLTVADALVTLGQHMHEHPDLAFANLKWQFYKPGGFVSGLDIQTRNPADMISWARTLANVTSSAERGKSGTVYGFVFGRIADVPVHVWDVLSGDAFPDESGPHEWDVHVQLQEA